jgi:hypothetical protein
MRAESDDGTRYHELVVAKLGQAIGGAGERMGGLLSTDCAHSALRLL